MAERRIDIYVGTKYDASGVKSAVADVAKLRTDLAIGGPGGIGPLTHDDQQIEQVAKKRIVAMERAADKSRIDEIVGKKLFGGLQQATAGREHEGGMLGLIEKFGLTNGPETLAKRLTAVAGRYGVIAGVAAGVGKAAALGIEYLNFRDDVARHESQGNIERQLDDEKRANEFKRSVFIAGPLAAAVADRFNLNNYHRDKVAIEESEDATKFLNQKMARQQATADMLKESRLSSRDATLGLQAGIAGHLQTPEQQAIISAQMQVDVFKRKMDEIRQNNHNKVPDEVNAELVARQKIMDLAVQDEARIHGRKMFAIESETSQELLNLQKDYLGARHVAMFAAMKMELDQTLDVREKLAVAWKNTVKLGAEFFNEFSAKRRFILKAGAEGDELRLAFAGKASSANIERIRRERDEALAEEFDSDRRAAILKKSRAAEDVAVGLEGRDRAAANRAQAMREFDEQSSLRERAERLSGDHYSADREELARRRADRLAEIDRQRREQLDAHRERASDINAAAAQNRAAAEGDFQIGTIEMQARLGEQFRVHPSNIAPMGDTRLLTGTGSAFKQSGNIDQQQLDILKKLLAIWQAATPLLTPPNLQ